MQPLGDVLQNSCSKPLLKKQLNHTYEKLHRGIFYNRSRKTVLWLGSEFQMIEVISKGSWGSEVPGGPRVQRSWGFRESMGSWGTGIPGSRGFQGFQRSRGSQDWVPLFYHALDDCFWIRVQVLILMLSSKIKLSYTIFIHTRKTFVADFFHDKVFDTLHILTVPHFSLNKWVFLKNSKHRWKDIFT